MNLEDLGDLARCLAFAGSWACVALERHTDGVTLRLDRRCTSLDEG